MESGNKDTDSCLSARLDSLCVAVIQLTLPSNLKNQAVTPCREKFYSLKPCINGALVMSALFSILQFLACVHSNKKPFLFQCIIFC